MSVPEFSRPVRIDTLGGTPRAISIEAEAGERDALARRFDLLAVGRLAADATLTRNGDEVIAQGKLDAQVVQSCVATAEPVPACVAERFRILFRPQPAIAGPDEEIELGEAEMDVVFYEGGAVDLGEAVAETLSLSLDPYPRAPDADAALRAAGVRSEEEARAAASPFAALGKTKP